jgi:hypothetical protein
VTRYCSVGTVLELDCWGKFDDAYQSATGRPVSLRAEDASCDLVAKHAWLALEQE